MLWQVHQPAVFRQLQKVGVLQHLLAFANTGEGGPSPLLVDQLGLAADGAAFQIERESLVLLRLAVDRVLHDHESDWLEVVRPYLKDAIDARNQGAVAALLDVLNIVIQHAKHFVTFSRTHGLDYELIVV